MAVRRKGRAPKYYGNVPLETVAAYADKLLTVINQQLSQAVSFTREDLLQLQVLEFQQVATITRYQATRLAVRYLLDRGDLLARKSPDLCLPANADRYQFENTTVTEEYARTIRRLVRAMPPSEPFVVSQVVGRWRTDPQLTMDTKRKAIRLALPRLVREGVCVRVNHFEFMIGTGNGRRN